MRKTGSDNATGSIDRKRSRSDEAGREQLRLVNAELIGKVEELEAANLERRNLLGRLFMAHEEERERIAGDLHDDSIQAMVALRMRLEVLAAGEGVRPELARELEDLGVETAAAVERLRNLLFELQPVELRRSGLRVVLEACLEEARAEDGLAYELEDRITRRPTQAVETILYRVGREALTNVRKHANASRVVMELNDEGGGFCLKVVDDGQGFDPKEGFRMRAGHLGLPAMRERVEIAGGHLEVNSRPGAGTALEVWLPDFELSGAVEGQGS